MILPAILLDAPPQLSLPPAAAAPAAEGFGALLQSHLPMPAHPVQPVVGEGEPEGEEDEAVDPMAMLAAPPIDLLQLCQGVPPADGAAPLTDAAPSPPVDAVQLGTSPEAEAPEAPPAQAPADAVDDGGAGTLDGSLPPAEPTQAPRSAEPAPLAELAEAPQARGVDRADSVRAAPPASEAPPASARESEVQFRAQGLDKLSLKISEGGDRFDVEIERGVDRTLDVRVIAPPDAVDEIWSMESELQQSLEERALKLGSYSAEARDSEADAEEDVDSDAEPGSETDEVHRSATWQGGALNIRA